jgi:putative aminopeptidase FrvX
MHTPKEALSLKDLQNTGKLIAAYAMSRYGAKEDCHE